MQSSSGVQSNLYTIQFCAFWSKATYQCSGSGVSNSLCHPLLALLLPLLLQPFLSLTVLVPGEDPCHTHPRTREVELVAQFDQGVVFPQNLHHLHLHLWKDKGKKRFPLRRWLVLMKAQR